MQIKRRIPIFRKIRFIVRSTLSRRPVNFPITGMNQIVDKQKSTFIRLLWFLVLCTCFGVCCFQIYLRLTEYIEAPVAVDYKFVVSEEINMPKLHMISTFTEEYLHLMETSSIPQGVVCPNPMLILLRQAHVLQNKTDLKTLWKLANTTNLFKYGRVITEDATYDLQHYEVNSSFGGSLAFHFDTPLKYKGSDDPRLEFKFRTATGVQCTTGVSVIFQDLGGVTDLQRSIPFALGSIVNLDTDFKTYRFLDHRNERCTTYEAVKQCRNECLASQLRSLSCRFPFMDFVDLPLCKVNNETIDKYIQNNMMLLQPNYCNCPRKCHDTFCLIHAAIIGKSKNETTIRMGFLTNERIVITERLAYDADSLLSDVGGNLGLCLGMSILSVTEFCYLLWIMCNKPKPKYVLRQSLMVKVQAILDNERKKRDATERNSCTVSNTIRLITTGICIAMSSYFIYLRLLYYYSYPTRTILQIKTPLTIPYPSVTICGPNNKITRLKYRVAKQRRETRLLLTQPSNKLLPNWCPLSICDLLDVQIKGINLEFLWKLSSINENHQKGVDFSKDVTGFTAIVNVTQTEVDMPLGRCMHFVAGKQTYYGVYSSLVNTFTITPTYNYCELYYQIYITAEHELTSLNEVKRIPHGMQAGIGIYMQMVKRLSTVNNPCVDTQTALRCIQDCSDVQLLKLIDCRLPYMKNYQLPLCNTSQTAKRAAYSYELVNRTISSFLRDCGCLPKCESTIINVQSFMAPVIVSSYTVIGVPFASSMVEYIIEISSYDLSTLLCDVGGNLGITLGASMLSLFEFIEGFYSRCKLRC